MNPGGEIPVFDGMVDAASGVDIVSPAIFWSWPGEALEFDSGGRPATDIRRYLFKGGVRGCRGWMPILNRGADMWVIKVQPEDVRKAEGLLRKL